MIFAGQALEAVRIALGALQLACGQGGAQAGGEIGLAGSELVQQAAIQLGLAQHPAQAAGQVDTRQLPVRQALRRRTTG